MLCFDNSANAPLSTPHRGMESRFGAGDRRPHPASGDSPSASFPHPLNGYFRVPAMRPAGTDPHSVIRRALVSLTNSAPPRAAGRFPLPLPLPFELEAARRECFIREEVERRLIEAEVRRANYNLPFVGGFGPNPFIPPMPMPVGEFGAWQQGPYQLGPRRQAEFGQRVMLHGEETRLPPKPKHKLKLRKIHLGESSKVLSSEKKVSRPKRKSISVTVPIEPMVCSKESTKPSVGSKQKTTEPRKERKLSKDWRCALCQVSATSEAGLNGHLEGKKHKLKLAQCGPVKVQTTTGNNNGTGTIDAPKKIVIIVDGAMHEVVQKNNYLWCERCKIRCDSNVNMAGHLRGKKHSGLNKVWTSIKAARMDTEIKDGLACNHKSKVNKNDY